MARFRIASMSAIRASARHRCFGSALQNCGGGEARASGVTARVPFTPAGPTNSKDLP
jgi:hypothetical protein